MAAALKSPLASGPQDACHSPMLASLTGNSARLAWGNPFGLAARHRALMGVSPNLAGGSLPATFLNSKAFKQPVHHDTDLLRASTPHHECLSLHANSIGEKAWNSLAGNQPEQLRQGRA